MYVMRKHIYSNLYSWCNLYNCTYFYSMYYWILS